MEPVDSLVIIYKFITKHLNDLYGKILNPLTLGLLVYNPLNHELYTPARTQIVKTVYQRSKENTDFQK